MVLKKVISLGVLASGMLLSATVSYAQVNNDNGESVYKAQKGVNLYREGEVIVKIKGASPVRIQARINSIKSGVKSFDDILQEMGVVESENLMPLTGTKNIGRKVKAYDGNTVTSPDLGKLYLLKFDKQKGGSVAEAINTLGANDNVEFAEPNYIVHTMSDEDKKADEYWNDPFVSQQWGYSILNLHRIHSAANNNGKRKVIAILDTGVDISHPDLAANIWKNEIENDGAESTDDDNNTFIDDYNGWDFINNTNVIRDYNGHGTHCAGIAAAVGNNGIGIVGANPDAFIMPVTVMQSDGTGDIATIIKGVDYANANHADVISMSIGTYSESIAFEQCLAKAYMDVVLVASAGNDGICQHTYHNGAPMFPASYSFVLGVESVNEKLETSSFSNYDCDGPIFSVFGEDFLYNYELKAPGANILSTYPNGKYKTLSGTSMACPFAAGVISLLLQTKDYPSKEELFGDVIHTCVNGIINPLGALSLNAADRKPMLEIVSYIIDDSKLGDGDGRPDSGETIDIYPIIRNSWGEAKNIRCSIETAELEDEGIISIINNNVDFSWELSAYAKGTSVNPIRIKISDECADGRHIRLVIKGACDSAESAASVDLVFDVENGVELGGMIAKDMTLYPNVHYIVTSNLAIPEGVTMTIMPGTILKFKDNTGISCSGKLFCKGTPDSLIVFTKDEHEKGYIPLIAGTSFEYVKFVDFGYREVNTDLKMIGDFTNCIFDGITTYGTVFPKLSKATACNFVNGIYERGITYVNFENSNIVNNRYTHHDLPEVLPGYSQYNNCNIIGNRDYNSNPLIVAYKTDSPAIVHPEQSNYLGSSVESIVRKGVYDMNNPRVPLGYGLLDLSGMLLRPAAEAHGVVWKIVVNGYDAQDEYDKLPALGVGKHKVEVYFNRPMDSSIAPTVAMGVRTPFNQVPINLDGSWNESHDIYTVYFEITGKTSSDGVNRITVSGAQDLDHFTIPEENFRFNVNVQVAGSMSSGFTGESGMGMVKLSWADAQNSFDDFLGYNLYRFEDPKDDSNEETRYYYDYNWNKITEKGHYDEYGNWIKFVAQDTIRINDNLLDSETLEYIDYNVLPGKTYYYFYKVITTDLFETDASNIIACVPYSAQKGDSNGSMSVDVADVMTDVAYIMNEDPKPFIFEAADVNDDNDVNILDIIGTANMIVAPSAVKAESAEETAIYTIEDGYLYVDCPVALGGVQVRLKGDKQTSVFEAQESLKGMEQLSAWQTDEDWIFLSFSMTENYISTGKQAILQIGDAEIKDVVLSDMRGRNILAINGTSDVVDGLESLPYGLENSHKVMARIHDMSGREVSAAGMKMGVYVVSLYVDGRKVKSYKMMNK